MPKVTIITPCYYNQDNLPVTSKALIDNERNFPPDVTFEYILIDDGSGDGTWPAMQEFQRQYPDKVKLIKLVRNFGSNNASLAGITHATGDCISIVAADLQDPPEIVAQMYTYWQQGMKLVLANRSNRDDGRLSDMLSNIFHYLVRRTALPNAPKGGFDLCLFDRCVRAEMVKADEKNLYIPYFLMWLGYPYVNIPYTRRKREIGRSRWTFSKKIKSFVDSFVGFSYLPIRVITIMGLLLGAISLIYGVLIIIGKLMGSVSVDGWSSMMVVLLFVSSFQMIALGIIGEYVWRSLDAARNRPNFIIDQIVEKNATNDAA